MEPESNLPLEKLQDTNLVVTDETADIRGRRVIDSEGIEIGHVSALFVDTGARKVQMIEIRAGGFLGLGDRHFLLPISAITNVTDHDVSVRETRERIVGSPAYDPDLTEAPPAQYWEPFYGYYGLAPYWGTDQMFPTFPLVQSDTAIVDAAMNDASSEKNRSRST